MGGHGGLNILPQKSWNVYGRENRLKVSRDEAKHADEERERQAKQRQADGEVRRRYLLLQAQRKAGTADPAAEAALATAQASARDVVRADSSGAAEAAGEGAAVAAASPAGGLLQHINFFQEHEARDEHPEVREEKRQEKRRRGDEATQTSDARFDERFALAHGLTGRAAQPWYSRRGSTLPGSELPGSTLAPTALAGPTPDPAPLAGRPGSPARTQRLQRPKDAKKERRSKKRSRRRDEEEGSDVNSKAARLEALREEGRQREAAEAARARALLFASADEAGAARNGKRYHGAFRAPLPRRPAAAGGAP